jgi:hypothetical protein
MQNSTFHTVNILEFIFQNLFFQPIFSFVQQIENTNLQSRFEYISIPKEKRNFGVQSVFQQNSFISNDMMSISTTFISIIHQLI